MASKMAFARYKYIQIHLVTRVIPHFDVILTGQSVYGTIFMIQGQRQGQEVNSKVKNMFFNVFLQIWIATSLKPFWCDFDWIINF